MKTTNKLFALILAVVMTVSLAACAKQPAGAPDPKTPSPTAAELSNKIDLTTTQFKTAERFSEGLAWVNYMDCSTLINKEGDIIYQADGRLQLCSPVQDGVCYYKKSSSEYGILDKEGNILYKTSGNETILAYGDGKFLSGRTESGFNQHGKSIGAIDKNGKEVTDFVSIDDDIYIDLEGEWKYLDDGIFYEVSAKGEFPWVFDTTNGKLRNNNTDDSWKFPIEETTKSENGKIWVTTGKGLTTFNMHEWEPIKQIDSSKEKSYEITKACSIVGKTGVVDGVYYDLNGEKIAEVDLYQDQVIERGEFSEAGYAPLVMNDQGHEYITYVNKKGEQQFEPKAINAGSKATEIINGDYFAVAYSDQHVVVIYDYTGQEKHRVENLDVVKILGDDYIISDDKYYFFQ